MTDATTFIQGRTAFQQAPIPPKIGKIGSVDEARRVAEDFEAFFLGQMLQPMFANLGAEEPFGGGPAEDTWRSLQVDEYGKAIARAGGIGISDMVFREILKTQEVA
jgi:peptidoglycan hydrolase FlgJ